MLTLIFGQLSAQDLVVTKNGDSIQCQIVTIKHNNIYYRTEIADDATLPKTLSKSEVKKYKYGYYNQNVDDGSPKDLIVTNDGDSIRCKIKYKKYDYLYYTTAGDNADKYLSINNLSNYKYNYYCPRLTDYHRVVLSFNGGYSQRLAKIGNGKYAEYNKKLNKGYHLGGDVVYYFSEYLGCGAKVTAFQSSNSQDAAVANGSYYYTTERWYNAPSLDNYATPNVIIGHPQFDKFTLKDKHTIYYVGPMFSSRFFDMGKGAYLINCSVGYLSYIDEGTDENGSFTIKGNTAGVLIECGYDYWFLKNSALGFRLSLIGGNIKECTKEVKSTTEKIESNNHVGLGRLDVSVGLRFGK